MEPVACLISQRWDFGSFRRMSSYALRAAPFVARRQKLRGNEPSPFCGPGRRQLPSTSADVPARNLRYQTPHTHSSPRSPRSPAHHRCAGVANWMTMRPPAPSPGTPGEGWGEGDFEFQCPLVALLNHPHPYPLPGAPPPLFECRHIRIRPQRPSPAGDHGLHPPFSPQKNIDRRMHPQLAAYSHILFL